MINTQQFRDLVIGPTLIYLKLYSVDAEKLLLGTAAHESRLSFLKQHPTGPALGVYQMETATHDDIWNNFLLYKPLLAEKVRLLAGPRSVDNGVVEAIEMIGNMYYATAMARIHYFRKREPLPDSNNIELMGKYWKQHYNTPLGAGTVDQFIKHYPRDIQ